MMSFRRILFWAIAMVMLTVLPVELVVPHPMGDVHAVRDTLWIASPFAMLVWCAGFRKLEPSLALNGFIASIFYLVFSCTVTTT